MACPEFYTLHNGAKMPLLGIGTLQAKDDAGEQALNAALEAGYRHIDTATRYDNEHVIGKVLSSWISQGKLKREDLFITTKLPPVGFRAEAVEKWLKRSLEKLQTDYVDLYLIHTPCGFQERGEEMNPRDADGNMLLDMTTDHLSLWKALEAQVDAGRAKAIGISNFTSQQIQRILDNCRIKPANLQVELHVYLQQRELVDLCTRNGISVTAYGPLGNRSFAAGQPGAVLPDLLLDPTVKEIAQKHNKTPAQIALKHLVQKGIIAIPKSINPQRLVENIQIFDFKLSADEVNKLNAIDRGEDGRIFIFHKNLKGLEKHPEYPWKDRV